MVEAYQGDHRIRTDVLFAERCAVVSDKPRVATVDISAVAQSLFDLAREALPRDTLFQRMALPAVARDETPPPQVVVVPPTGEEIPKFGEYVYVEELPECVTAAQPVYPADAMQAGVQGRVVVQVLVGKDGLVKDARIVSSIPMLDAAALTAVRNYRFTPARSKGQPVAVWVAVPVKFALR